MSFLLSAVAGQGGAVVPGAPGTLSLSAGSPDTTVIDLSWSAPSDTGGGTISGYRIKKDGSVLVADTGSTGTTYSATGLTADTEYNFNVAAINEAGTGPDGNTPALTTAANVITATGGTIVSYSGYKSHTFTSSGTFEITANPGSDTFDVLVIGGGGSSKSSTSPGGDQNGGGGGAGAFRVATGQTGTVQTYTVTIGAGGASSPTTPRGVDTVFDSLTADGGEYGGGNGAAEVVSTNASGGGGGGHPDASWWTGGPGGTGGAYGNNGQGSQVYLIYGCGGGAGGGGADGSEPNHNSNNPIGGTGGAGGANTYRDGTSEVRCGGGGGSAFVDNTNSVTSGPGGTGGGGNGGTSRNGTNVLATSGTANTGSGGGGCASRGVITPSGNGGSGIVIVRYAV